MLKDLYKINEKKKSNDLPYSDKFWRGFNLAMDQNDFFGVDLILRWRKYFKFGMDLIWWSRDFLKFGVDLIWRSKNIYKFGMDLIWRRTNISQFGVDVIRRRINFLRIFLRFNTVGSNNTIKTRIFIMQAM